MIKHIKYILILIILVGLFSPLVKTQAVETSNTNYQLLAPLPDPGTNKMQTNVNTTGGLGSYLNPMIKLFIGLCAVLSVIMIIVGGLEYMTSELSHTKEAGKERIMHAILGLLIALGAYALLYTINPDLLNSNPKIPNTIIIGENNGENCSDHELATKELCEQAGATWTPTGPKVIPAVPLPGAVGTGTCSYPQYRYEGACVAAGGKWTPKPR